MKRKDFPDERRTFQIFSFEVSRNIFIRGMGFVYLSAFASLYLQWPGLFGNDGIFPATARLKQQDQLKFSEFPTLAYIFADAFSISYNTANEMTLLLGMFLSTLVASFDAFACTTSMITLWLLYLSVYCLGQTFFQSQVPTSSKALISTMIASMALLSVLVCFQSRSFAHKVSHRARAWGCAEERA